MQWTHPWNNMIPEIGQLLMITALAAALLQFLIGLKLFTLDQPLRMILIKRFTLIQCLSIFLAICCLGYSFLNDDFSVLYIALNSNTNLPVPYKIAAIWGAHEGSLLLWMFLLSFWGVTLAFSKKFNDQDKMLKIYSLSILAVSYTHLTLPTILLV